MRILLKMAAINLPLIVGAGLIDGINPCAFGVLIFLLAYLAKTAKNKKGKMILHGLTYIFAVFLTYLLAGLLLLPVIRQLGQTFVILYIGLATIIIIAGLLEIKDYFWYGKWFSLSIFPKEAERIKKYGKKMSGKLYIVFFLGVFVALVELPCTGAVYLAVLSLMSLSGLTISNFTFLLIYNFLFVLPLIVILFLVVNGMSTNKFNEWRKKNRALMRLLIGLLLIGLGSWMLLLVL